MNSRALHRLLAAMLVMIATLAIPGEALAHGYAHLGHEQTQSIQAVQSAHGPVASESDDDHPHPDAACAARWGGRTVAFVIPAATKVPTTLAITTARSVLAMTLARHPGDPWPGPPPRVRAPPLG